MFIGKVSLRFEVSAKTGRHFVVNVVDIISIMAIHSTSKMPLALG